MAKKILNSPMDKVLWRHSLAQKSWTADWTPVEIDNFIDQEIADEKEHGAKAGRVISLLRRNVKQGFKENIDLTKAATEANELIEALEESVELLKETCDLYVQQCAAKDQKIAELGKAVTFYENQVNRRKNDMEALDRTCDGCGYVGISNLSKHKDGLTLCDACYDKTDPILGDSTVEWNSITEEFEIKNN